MSRSRTVECLVCGATDGPEVSVRVEETERGTLVVCDVCRPGGVA